MAGRLLDPIVNVPPSIQQGDTVTWTDSPPGDVGGVLYTSADWNLVFTFLQNGGTQSPVSVTAAPQGNGWETTLTPTQTAALAVGSTYLWQVRLMGIANDPISENIVITVDNGTFAVVANLAAASAGYDGRSFAVQTLEALEAGLAAVAGTGGQPVLSYKISTREMHFRTVEDLMSAISYWRAAVISEQVANSLAQNQGNPRKLYGRFPSSWGSSA